jgi:hypothetical protein
MAHPRALARILQAQRRGAPRDTPPGRVVRIVDQVGDQALEESRIARRRRRGQGCAHIQVAGGDLSLARA